MIANSNVRVSAELRREHSKAISQRDRWRERYATVSGVIRATKRRLAQAHKSNTVDRAAEVQLSILRSYANYMMYDREHIKSLLQETAYEYVDEETVA